MDATTFNIGICEMSADLFVQSVKKGYDSKDFIEKLMKSETAKHLYNKTVTQMWLGSNYIIETLDMELTLFLFALLFIVYVFQFSNRIFK